MDRRTTVIWLVASMLLAAACSRQPEVREESPQIVLAERIMAFSSDTPKEYSGVLQAGNRAVLGFRTGGRIDTLTADLGDRVRKGDVLGRLDEVALRLDLDRRQADLSDALASLKEAQADYDRRSALAGTGAVSQSSIDQALARRDSAAARVQALQADVGRAADALQNARLIAPFDGEIAERLVEPAQVVSAGEPVYRIFGTNAGLEAVISIPDYAVSDFEIGTPAIISTRSRRQLADAQVIEIGQSASAGGLFPVTLAVQSLPSDGLSPGLSVAVRVSSERDEGVILIPLTAFAAGENDTAYVFVIDMENSVLKRTRIEIASITDRGALVVSGIDPGAVIVTKGIDFLKDGQTVEPVIEGETIARYIG